MLIKTILIFMFVFPFFTNALNCGYGGLCHGFESNQTLISLKSKACENACFSFKCFVNNFEIMEGAGCYEDFINTCKYVATDLKVDIKKNFHNNSISNDILILKSCNDSDGCATKGFGSWKMDYSKKNSTFGSSEFKEPSLICEYNNIPMPSLPKLRCGSTGWCRSGKQFVEASLINWGNWVNAGEKECDACVYFHCSENGSNVITAWGCYEDFLHACPFVADTVKEKLHENIKDAFYYGENYVVISCSYEDNCDEKYSSLHKNVYKNFKKGINVSADAECLYEPLSILPSSPHTTHESVTKLPYNNSVNTNILDCLSLGYFLIIYLFAWKQTN